MLRRLLISLLTVAGLLFSCNAAAVKIRVRGGAELHAQARFVLQGEVLELRGMLSDDDRTPIAAAWVELKSAASLGVASTCEAPRVSLVPRPSLKAQTTLEGELCVRWTAAPDKGAVELRFVGDTYHSAAQLSVSFDRTGTQRLATRLRFEPRPVTLDLDRRSVGVSAVLSLALRTTHASAAGLPITLHDEADRKLATGKTGGDGKVRFEIATKQLGKPGNGKLQARFAGTTKLSPAMDEQALTRRIRARLTLAHDIAPTDPGDDALVSLFVRSAKGDVDNGVVEALVAGRSVASGPVVGGRAELHVALDLTARQSVDLRVRYLPSSPWFLADSPLKLTIPVAPPSMVLRLLLSLVVVAAAMWVFVSWRRSKKRARPDRGKLALPPGVHIVKSTRGAKSWRGTVIDAHEGWPLADVEVFVHQPTLVDGEDGLLVRAITDRYGKFAFDLEQRPDGAEIVAQSATHSAERKLLPAGGTLRIALVTRRRAVLRRFVNWARRRGRPYDRPPEPTPAQVRGAAKAEPDVARWASEVETVAFGPAEVDAEVEQSLRDVEPRA